MTALGAVSLQGHYWVEYREQRAYPVTTPCIWANSSREDKYSLVKLAVPCAREVWPSF